MTDKEHILEQLTGKGGACEIEQIEVNGARIRTWKNAPASMAAIIESSRRRGEREFIVFHDERLSFEEHYRRVAALAHTLVEEFGVERGDRVVIAMRNFPEWIVAFWAITSAGAVAVPLNAWWTSQELAYGVTDSGARVAIVDEKRYQRLQEAEEPLPIEHYVGVRFESAYPDGVLAIDRVFEDVEDAIALPGVDIQPDDHATLFYTSGTTGRPKGTLGTHRNFCSVAGAIGFNGAQILLRMGGRLEDLPLLEQIPQAALLIVPLFHVAGCHGIMLPMLLAGGKLVLLDKWDPVAALDAIETEKITMLTGVPALIGQLMQQPGLEQRDLSSILQLGYGGAPAPPELLRSIKARAPSAMVTNGWGITETSSAISFITGQDYLDRPSSVGLPLAVCEVKAVDTEGREVGPNELGEFWVRGPNVAMGYWNNPEATAGSFTDGWFHTGDVGRIDEDGFIYILDRLKDMIIRGGENVYCAEVEAALVEHPGVSAACVFGMPSESLGEEVAAVVVLCGDDTPGEEELRDFVRGRIANFKVPAKLWLRREPLPLGATGKVQKKELKAHYLGGSAN